MHVDHLGDRREGGQRVDRHFRKQVLVDREVAERGHQQGVAIRRGARRDLGADHAAGAGAVLDNHPLAPQLAKLLPDHAGHDVGAAAGREGHDDAHQAIREALRAGMRTDGREHQADGQPYQHPHVDLP